MYLLYSAIHQEALESTQNILDLLQGKFLTHDISINFCAFNSNGNKDIVRGLNSCFVRYFESHYSFVTREQCQKSGVGIKTGGKSCS